MLLSETETKDENCIGFFRSTIDIEAASNLLITTVWDSADKKLIESSRKEISRLMGYHMNHSAVLGSRQTSSSVNIIRNTGDKLDSYESLVRDAGNE